MKTINNISKNSKLLQNSYLFQTHAGLKKYDKDSQTKTFLKKALLIFCGSLIGIVNGLFGAGGGMIAVPILTYIAKLDEKKSHATAILVILPICAVSTIVYITKSSFDFSIFPTTILGVILGGALGGFLLKKINSNFLTFAFYCLMLIAGIKMIIAV